MNATLNKRPDCACELMIPFTLRCQETFDNPAYCDCIIDPVALARLVLNYLHLQEVYEKIRSRDRSDGVDIVYFQSSRPLLFPQGTTYPFDFTMHEKLICRSRTANTIVYLLTMPAPS